MKFHKNYIKEFKGYSPDPEPDVSKRYIGNKDICVKVYSNKKEIATISIVQIYKEAEYESLWNDYYNQFEGDKFNENPALLGIGSFTILTSEEYENINLSRFEGVWGKYNWMEFKYQNKKVECIPILQHFINRETLELIYNNKKYSLYSIIPPSLNSKKMIGIPRVWYDFPILTEDIDYGAGYLYFNDDGLLCYVDDGEFTGYLLPEHTDIQLLNPITMEWIPVEIDVSCGDIVYFNGPEIPEIQFIKDIKKYGKK